MADEAKAAAKRPTTREQTAGLQNAFAALRAVPADPEPAETAKPASRPARRPKPKTDTAAAGATARPAPAARTPRKPSRPEPMPAEQKRPPAWDARISLTLTRDMKRDLDLARAEDGLELTARIRAMITLWQDGGKYQAEVDKLARNLR